MVEASGRKLRKDIFEQRNKEGREMRAGVDELLSIIKKQKSPKDVDTALATILEAD